MKHVVIIIGFVTLLLRGWGQNFKDGLYLNYAELSANNPSYVMDSCDELKKKFPAGLENIKLKKCVCSDSKKCLILQVPLGSIFAYVYKGKIHRYYSTKSWKMLDGYYLVVEIGKIVIYSKTETTGGKYGAYTTMRYFFSRDLNSEIYPLEKKYLKMVLSADEYSKIESLKNEEEKDKEGHFLINQLIK